MGWNDLTSTQTVSFNNLQSAVDLGYLSRKASIPVSNEQITKTDADTYVYLNTAYPSYAAKASNQLVVKKDLQSPISAPYEYTLYYAGCYSGCIDPEVRLQGENGLIKAADLKVGDMINSDLGLGMVSYIENKTQNKFLIKTSERVIPVSDTHQFIDEIGNVIIAEQLTVGTRVTTDEGIEEITSITELGEGPVIDITVEGTHHYYANGFLSHNKPCYVIGGWTSSSSACSGVRTSFITVYSPDSPLTSSSNLYGSTTGGALYSFENSLPYVYLSSDQWAQIQQIATPGYYDIISIGTCGTSYDFYTAEAYDCNGCVYSENLLVCFLAGSSVTINRFYVPASYDGFAYKITGTASSGVAYILSTAYGSFTTCGFACAI